jgi:hypothetical protein
VVSATWQRSRGDSANILVSATDDRAVASVELTVETGGQTLRSTCGDGKLSCTPTAGGWTFQVTGVGDDARFSAAAQDGVGNLAATATETLSMTAPVAPKVTAEVAVRPGESGKVLWVTARVVSTGTAATSATLHWTDATGTHALPMCPPSFTFGSNSAFYLPIAADQNSASRVFDVEVTDGSAGTARTASQQLALP